MYKYKNTTGMDMVVMGHGIVDIDGFVESETEIENPNLQLVDSSVSVAPIEVVAHEPINVEPITTTETESSVIGGII